MPVRVFWSKPGALVQKLRDVEAAAKLNGKGSARVKGDFRKIVIDDNTDKLLGRGLLEGVDRFGKPLARMADSTFRNKRRGFGPVLAPRGLASRFITNFRAEWEDAGGFKVLSMRWLNVVSKQGRSFVQYHLTGCPRGSNKKHPNWSLPKRDVGGISPKGMAKVRERFRRFAGDVLKGGA